MGKYRLPRGSSLIDRLFADRLITESGCWEWQGARTTRGYGTLSNGGRHGLTAHRASYELFVAPIPTGLQVDHLCRNPPCFNPDHLEPVTPRENTLRGTSPAARQAAQTHCVHGHEFDEENTYRWQGHRLCRRCRRERLRAFRARRRGDFTYKPDLD